LTGADYIKKDLHLQICMQRWAPAFALAIAKLERGSAKTAKAQRVQEKSANSRFSFPLTLEARPQSPKMLGRGKSKGLE
jgi:hypothetical protein